VASVGDDGALRLWTAGPGLPRSRAKAHGHTITSVAFSQDGKALATASRDHTVRVWDSSSLFGDELPVLVGQTNVHAALSADGRLMALWAPPGSLLTLYDLADRRTIKTTQFERDVGYYVALSPDGQSVVTSGPNQHIRRYSLDGDGHDARWTHQWEHHRWREEIFSLTFTPDGAWLAAATNFDLLLWPGQSKAPVIVPSKAQFTVGLSLDCQMLVAAHDSSLEFLDLRDLRWEGVPLELQASIKNLAGSRDGRLLAAGCADGRIVLIDPQARTVQGTFVGHHREITAMAFAPDCRTLVSGSKDGTVRLWNLATQQELFTLEDRLGTTINSVAFTPDGTTLITAGDPAGDFNNVMLWSAPRNEGR
jgi:WD40 repeat protein